MTTEKPTSDVVLKAIAGGTAGAVSRTCVAPLDRLKILLQTQPDPPKYRGVVHATRLICKEEGVLGLWRGNFANCFRIIPKTAVQYASFGFWTPVIGNLFEGTNASGAVGKMMSAGMLAGLSAQIATYPLDTVRARLTVDASGKLGGMFTALAHIVRTEGLGALYKGIFPTLCGSVPYVGIEFSVYGTLKQTSFVPRDPQTGQLTVPGKLLCGACAAITGQTITYPFDLVRRRMQVEGYSANMRKYTGLIDAVSSIFKNEGFFAFYRGLLPNYLKSVPAVAITWAVYEETMQMLRK